VVESPDCARAIYEVFLNPPEDAMASGRDVAGFHSFAAFSGSLSF
jgi:hypothetical protein